MSAFSPRSSASIPCTFSTSSAISAISDRDTRTFTSGCAICTGYVFLKPHSPSFEDYCRPLLLTGTEQDYPAFKETTDFEHIKKHYTKSHGQINKFQITPIGPLPDIFEKDDEVPSVKAAKK